MVMLLETTDDVKIYGDKIKESIFPEVYILMEGQWYNCLPSRSINQIREKDRIL